MNIQLKKLTLTNFKGIRSLSVIFSGNTSVFGANEMGKSTLYTAFSWLLTGKDEFDRKDYEIKNTKLKELNAQAHEVEAVFVVNGQEVKLKRVYLEDWQKPKGQATKVFKGHYTDYYVNDVPCSAKEYQQQVDAIIDPQIIKLVTNPTYFNTLKWDDQRRGLIAIAGEVTNEQVIDAIATPQNDYGTLIMVLNGGKSLDQWKKELAAKKGLLKKAAVEYGPRIDELKRSLPEEQDWELVESSVKYLKSEIESIEESLSDASKAAAEKQKGVLAKQKELYGKQNALSNIRFKIKGELQAAQGEEGQQIAAIQQEIKSRANRLEMLRKEENDRSHNIAVYEQQIADKEARIVQLRKEWDLINSERFQFDESKCECPTCKQQLPPDDIELQKNTLLKNFADSVARRKQERVAQSTQVKTEIAQLRENITAWQSKNNAEEMETLSASLAALQNRLQILQEQASAKKVQDIEAAADALLKVNADALNLQDEITAIEKEIAADASITHDSDTIRFKTRKAELQAELEETSKQLSIRDAIGKTKTRIAQLEEEEKTNAQAIADLELQEFEVESFSRAKMDIIQERVNGLFKYVSFRLFETQVNGAIADTCVCEYKGVPYPTLNTAAKLLAGLDVLNTLSRFYNVYAPVFCDNRESVSFVPESKSQIISLFVSPQDKKLRVETAAKLELETA